MANKRAKLIGPFGRRTALCVVIDDASQYSQDELSRVVEVINSLRSGIGYNVIAMLQLLGSQEPYVVSLNQEVEDVLLPNVQQSAFYANDRELTSLHTTLQQRIISDVHVVGMSETCFHTALDARSLGYQTVMIHNALILPTSSSTHIFSHLSHKIDQTQIGWFHSNSLLNPISVEPRVKTAKYMQEKHVDSFVEYLCAQVFFHQPINPREFLHQHLQNLYSKGVSVDSLSGRSLLENKDFERIYFALNTKRENSLAGPVLRAALTDLSMAKQASLLNDGQRYTVNEFVTICATE